MEFVALAVLVLAVVCWRGLAAIHQSTEVHLRELPSILHDGLGPLRHLRDVLDLLDAEFQERNLSWRYRELLDEVERRIDAKRDQWRRDEGATRRATALKDTTV